MTIIDTPQPPAPDPLLSNDDLAAYLQVPVGTVRGWRLNDTGPRGLRIGRHVRYRRSDVDRWLESR